MLLKELFAVYVVGLVISAFLLVGFFFLEFYLSSFVSYLFPIGYVVLIVCVVLLLPIGVGVINALAKCYVYHESREEISLSFWYYGVFLTLVFLSFRTLFSYMPVYVSLALTFTVVCVVVGVASKYV